MPVTHTTTAKEFETLLRQAAAPITPAEPPLIDASRVLARHRNIVLAFRAKGYSVEQLAQILKTPAIGLSISPTNLAKLLKAAPRKPPVRYTAAIPLKVPPPAGALVE